jgi:hypothetical protein
VRPRWKLQVESPVARSLTEIFALRVAGLHGAKPMSVGRFDSTKSHESAIIAVAMPLSLFEAGYWCFVCASCCRTTPCDVARRTSRGDSRCGPLWPMSGCKFQQRYRRNQRYPPLWRRLRGGVIDSLANSTIRILCDLYEPCESDWTSKHATGQKLKTWIRPICRHGVEQPVFRLSM